MTFLLLLLLLLLSLPLLAWEFAVQPLVLPDAPLDRMSAVFITLTLLAFTPSYTALVVWDHERLLLRRESSTNMYSR